MNKKRKMMQTENIEEKIKPLSKSLSEIYESYESSCVFEKKTGRGYLLITDDKSVYSKIKEKLKALKEVHQDLKLSFNVFDFTEASEIKLRMKLTKVFKEDSAKDTKSEFIIESKLLPGIQDFADEVGLPVHELVKLYRERVEYRMNFSLNTEEGYRIDDYNIGTFSLFYSPIITKNDITVSDSTSDRIDRIASKNMIYGGERSRFYFKFNAMYKDMYEMFSL